MTVNSKFQFDLTPEMASGIRRTILEYTENGEIACPKTAAYLRTCGFDPSVAGESVVDGPRHTYRPPNFHIVHTNKFFNPLIEQFDDSWMGELVFLWGETFPFKEWLGVSQALDRSLCLSRERVRGGPNECMPRVPDRVPKPCVRLLSECRARSRRSTASPEAAST